MKLILRRSREPFGRRLPMAAAAAMLGVDLSAGVGVSHAEDPPADQPGDVVSVEPYGFPLPRVPTPIDAWKHLYHSTDPLDIGQTGTHPLVTYAVGTVGMGDQCAPSSLGTKTRPETTIGCVLDNIAAGQGKSVSQLVTTDPLDTPEWEQRLAAETLGAESLGFPVYMFHGTNDGIVPFEFERQLQSDWCRLGNAVEWHAIPMAERMSAFVVESGAGADWLSHRLAGEPTPGNCAG
ncbi:lipase family protein [Nocardia fluminea]|uniref:lipase family protein n=1 Tax=Nocardia fluminea TaxID=134984 RepID=UPI0036515D7A